MPRYTNGDWPEKLWIVRHGQSAGNVARDAAEASGSERIELNTRDADTPLSDLGVQQSEALAEWFASAGGADARPDVFLTSPFVRSRQTLRIVTDALSVEGSKIQPDERLREKEFGIVDRYTKQGMAESFPALAAQRSLVGKFYFRPPGGESWCDVILRLRSLIDTVSLHYAGRHVMIFAHQVVVLCLRYIIENLDEAAILAIDRAGDVANCAITEYRFDPWAGKDGKLALVRYNVTAPIEQEQAPVTREPDPVVAARG